MLELNRRSAETITAMGFGQALRARWDRASGDYLLSQRRISGAMNGYSSLSRGLRLLLQSAILGAGAYLVIQQEVTSGAMIASSIMMARALAPVEQVIGNWRGLTGAREALRRLRVDLVRAVSPRPATALEAPHRSLDVDRLHIGPPGSAAPVLSDIHFSLQAGDAVAVVGASGSGKTSLAKALLAVWTPTSGTVRLDGATADQWDAEKLGACVGYVPQFADIFPATIAENIARMSLAPDSEAVIRAAKAANIHDLILNLPSGYDTMVGEADGLLSAGQRQRLALARALYGDPFLLVLDEPNSNLDGDGEAALLEAIGSARARGAIVVLVTHRPKAVSACNHVLLLAEGRQKAFGSRDAILRKYFSAPPRPTPPGPEPQKRVEAAE
jgi:ATP-binding cassette subfamily C protein